MKAIGARLKKADETLPEETVGTKDVYSLNI